MRHGSGTLFGIGKFGGQVPQYAQFSQTVPSHHRALFNQAEFEARLDREDMGSEAADEDGEGISLSSNNENDPGHGWENTRRRHVSNPGTGQTYMTEQYARDARDY